MQRRRMLFLANVALGAIPAAVYVALCILEPPRMIDPFGPLVVALVVAFAALVWVNRHLFSSVGRLPRLLLITATSFVSVVVVSGIGVIVFFALAGVPP